MADGNTPNTQDDKEKVYVKISHLKPGSILKGQTFTDEGKKLFPAYHVFNDEDIQTLVSRGLEKIYYIPVQETIAERSKQEGLAFMTKLMDSVKSGRGVDIGHARQVVDLMISDIYSGEIGMVNLLGLKDYSEYAYVHSINVSILSMVFARKMGLEEKDVREVGLGGMLHDVGKINTPADILWKIDGDSDYERTIIHEHPMFGYKILESSGNVPESVLKIVVGHHECYDGSGYPGKLTDKNIDRNVKIVSLCNYYDYLVEKAEGKESVSPREAVMKIMQMSGKEFNPMFINDFVTDLSFLLLENPLYPPGSMVLLDTREIALVMEVKKYSDLKPLVKILSGSDGKKMARPIVVDLKNDNKRHIERIVKITGS